LGLVHRDIKPENVLVTPDGQAKVTDRGLAKEMGGGSNLTRAGRGLGTPNFMAPEQFRDASNAGIRADVYALAATLYMMVTGALPFENRNLVDIFSQKLRDQLPPPRKLVPGLSERTDGAIRRAMSADPTRRPASCRVFLEELQGQRPQPLAPCVVMDTAGEAVPARAEPSPAEATDDRSWPDESTFLAPPAYGRRAIREVCLVGGMALLTAVITWYYLFR